MGVFSRGTYLVKVYRDDSEDPDEETYAEYPGELVESLRHDSSVRAVETYSVYCVVGDYQDDFSWGSRYEDEEAE
jgi:hypothetical protein